MPASPIFFSDEFCSTNTPSCPSATMSVPAAKKRKLGHNNARDEAEHFFSDHDIESIAASDDDSDDHDPTSDDDQLSRNGDPEGGASAKNLRKAQAVKERAAQGEGKAAAPIRKRLDALPQDGAYTSEVYKSNMFKLQIDELLDQVKPKYGKKQAPAEHAMRTLKTMIEQIPGCGPFSVGGEELSLNSLNSD
jgi:U3 small nucleolar RNA-associated protein 22